MPRFELDDDLFLGAGDTMVRQRLEGHGRVHTFKFSGSDQKPLEFVGYVVYTVEAGLQREGNG